MHLQHDLVLHISAEAPHLQRRWVKICTGLQTVAQGCACSATESRAAGPAPDDELQHAWVQVTGAQRVMACNRSALGLGLPQCAAKSMGLQVLAPTPMPPLWHGEPNRTRRCDCLSEAQQCVLRGEVCLSMHAQPPMRRSLSTISSRTTVQMLISCTWQQDAASSMKYCRCEKKQSCRCSPHATSAWTQSAGADWFLAAAASPCDGRVR